MKIVNITQVLTWVFLSHLFLSGAASSEMIPGTALRWSTLDKGFSCGISEKENWIIRDNDAWQKLAERVYQGSVGDSHIPEVNFTKEMIIGVFLGGRPTAGYTIEIMKVIEGEQSLTVFIEETSPPPGALTAQVLTQPYHLIVTAQAEKDIVFQID